METAKKYLKSIGYLGGGLPIESMAEILKGYTDYLESIVTTDEEVVEYVFEKIRHVLGIDRGILLLKGSQNCKDNKMTALRVLVTQELLKRTSMDTKSIAKLIGRHRSIITFYRYYYQPTEEYYFYKKRLSWH